MPGYMMKDKKKKKMYGYGGQIKKKKNVVMYKDGGPVPKLTKAQQTLPERLKKEILKG